MKKYVVSIVFIGSLISLLVWRNWNKVMLISDDYLPRFTQFHNLNNDEKMMLSETLQCFDLDPLTSDSLFVVRFSYYWDDGCNYRQVFELKCTNKKLDSCVSQLFYEKNGTTVVENKNITKDRIQKYRDEIDSMHILKMQSMQTESFFEHFGMIYRIGDFSYRFFEISTDEQKNVFGIAPGPVKEETYMKLLLSTAELIK